MKYISVLLCLSLSYFCLSEETTPAAEIDNSDTVKSLQELLPVEIAEKVANLTSSDIKAARKIFERLPKKEDLIKALNEQSPALKDLVQIVAQTIAEKVKSVDEALKPETKKFLEKVRNVLEKTFEKLKELYEKESESIKEDLRKQFPKLMLILEHPQIQADALALCGYGGYGMYRGGYGGGYGAPAGYGVGPYAGYGAGGGFGAGGLGAGGLGAGPYAGYGVPAANPYAANPYAANPYAANPYAANPYGNGLLTGLLGR